MPNTKFGCLPTMIGSMPHTDPEAACGVVTRFLKEIPAWPQLPRRSYLENMYVQYSEGFPGIIVSKDSIKVERSRGQGKPLEQLYAAYIETSLDQFAISRDYAVGLHRFLELTNLQPRAVKGQVTGPVTWGMTVTDEEGRPIIYDDILGDAVARFIRLKAAWQERELTRVSPNTIIFLDEPYMVAYGATSTGVGDRKKTIALFNEVFSGLKGLKGVHCCGNTDWSVLLGTKTDILSFDAYNFAESLGLYGNDVKAFIARGGAVAWGIVPNTDEGLAKETPASLQERLEVAVAPFTRDGLRFRDILAQSLLTPSCGLAGLSEEASGRALEMLAGLSRESEKDICSMEKKAITQVDVGSTRSFSKKVTEEDVRKFAEVTGDFNPLHLDCDYARKTIFGERVAHGMLSLGIVSAAVSKLPGVVVYVTQSARFLRPVKIGDTIEATVEVLEKTEAKSEVHVKTSCRNQKGEQVLDGEARIRLFDLKPE